MNLISKLFFCLLVMLLSKQSTTNLYKNPKRKTQARTLTFPVTAPTRVQYIAGIGIPVEDLIYEAVTSGYVLKAEYFLPDKAEDFTPNYLRPQRVHRRNIVMNDTQSFNTQRELQQKSDSRYRRRTHDKSPTFNSNFKSQQKQSSTYRWEVYKSIEIALTNAGLPGKMCLKRCICEHALAPMHYGAGLLGELLHIILTPSSSMDKLSVPHDKEYLNAEKLGHLGENCELHFAACTKSPMDLITAVFDLSNLNF